MNFSAEDIIKERLERCIKEKLSKANAFPESVWEFYSHLLSCAEKHNVDFSGYASPSYKADETEAKKRNAAMPEPEGAFHLPERKSRHI